MTDNSWPPWLTTLAAARYCNYKDASAIRKAVRAGRLRPSGRRGATGPHVFARDELDRFMRGEPLVRVAADRSGAPLRDGDVHEEQQQIVLDNTLEERSDADSNFGHLEKKGRRSSGASARGRSDDGQNERIEEGVAASGRSDGVQVAERSKGARARLPTVGAASENALLRLRDIAVRKEGKNR